MWYQPSLVPFLCALSWRIYAIYLPFVTDWTSHKGQPQVTSERIFGKKVSIQQCRLFQPKNYRIVVPKAFLGCFIRQMYNVKNNPWTMHIADFKYFLTRGIFICKVIYIFAKLTTI